MNTTVFKLHFTEDLSAIMPKITGMIDDIQRRMSFNIQLSQKELNSLYLAIPDNTWNLYKGIVTQDNIGIRDFQYSMGDITVDRLLDGNQRLVDNIQDTLRKFQDAFTGITQKAVNYAERKADIVFRRDRIDEMLAGKNYNDGISSQLDQMGILYANIIRQLDSIEQNTAKPADNNVYQALELLRQQLFHTIRELDSVITGQQLGMTTSQEMFWRIAAAQRAYNGESIEEAKNGEMGLSYDELVQAAGEIEKQIKQMPATDIKGIARLSATLANLNQRIDFLGAALHLQNEPFHRQTTINQAAKLIQNASTPQYKPDNIENTNTIAELQKAVNFYKQQIIDADAADIQTLADTIDRFTQKANALKGLATIAKLNDEVKQLQTLKGVKLKVAVDDIGLNDIQLKIKNLQDILKYGGKQILPEQEKQIKTLIKQWQRYEKVAKASAFSFRKTWNGIESVGDGIERIDTLCKGGASSWQIFTGIVDSAIQIFDGFQAVISIIQTLAAVSKATLAEDVSSAAIATTANKTQAMAARELAASEFMAAHASIPFAGAGIAAGFIAQMQAIVKGVAVTPFANGGLVYGPTLALMGEYPGARANPEVIAPLSKLQQLVAGNGHYVEIVGDSRVVKARVRGQDLELALANTTRINHRKSKIKLK